MNNPPAELVIGVDAGGSSTVAWLSDLNADRAEPLGQGLAGPGNPRAIGFNDATEQIANAISSAFADARLPMAPVAGLSLCVAGAGREDEQRQLHEWAKLRGLADHIQVSHDAAPILAAASADNVGIALISGTGSLAWGRNAEGDTERAGGWGYLFGDEGSGYTIALAGLRAAAQAADGRGPQTELLDAFMHRLQATTPSDLIGQVYRADQSREQLAASAAVVFDVASQDSVARNILTRAAQDLAAMVQTLAKRLRFAPSDFTLGLAGGVLIGRPDFRSAVIREIKMAPEHTVVVPAPVAGAIGLARRLVSGCGVSGVERK